MKKFLTNLKQETAGIRLSHAEKAAMKARIFGAPSPEVLHKSPYAFLSLFSYQTRMVMAGLMLLAFVGTGSVSAAAAGALPGDLLYPVKLSINERVETYLATDTSSKVALQVTLAERRVAEAQTLEAQGRLSKQTVEELAAGFDAHAAQALALAEPEEDTSSATVSVRVASAPESVAKNAAPVQTMMLQIAVAPAPEDQATSTQERADLYREDKTDDEERSRKDRDSVREVLRLKGEIIKEIKLRALRAELRSGQDDDR